MTTDGDFPVRLFSCLVACAVASPLPRSPRAVHRPLVAPVAHDRDARISRFTIRSSSRRGRAHIAARVEAIDSAVAATRRLRAGGEDAVVVDDPYSTANGSAWPFLNQPIINLWARRPTRATTSATFATWGEMLVVARVRAHRAPHTPVAQPSTLRQLWARASGRRRTDRPPGAALGDRGLRDVRRRSRHRLRTPARRLAPGACCDSGRSKGSCRATSSSNASGAFEGGVVRVSRRARRFSNGWRNSAATRVSSSCGGA